MECSLGEGSSLCVLALFELKSPSQSPCVCVPHAADTCVCLGLMQSLAHSPTLHLSLFPTLRPSSSLPSLSMQMSWRLASVYIFSTWTSLVIHWDFPCGGPVVKIPCFQCRGQGFDSQLGELRSTCLMAKKKKKNSLPPRFVGDCKAGVCMKVALNWKSAKCLAVWGRKKDLKDMGHSAVLSPCGKSRFPGDSAGKESACNAGDLGLIPGLGRSPGERNGYPLQYSGLENSMDRGAWRATVHGGRKELDTTEQLSLTHSTVLSPAWVWACCSRVDWYL